MWNTTRSNQSTKQDIYSIVKVNYIYGMYIEIENWNIYRLGPPTFSQS